LPEDKQEQAPAITYRGLFCPKAFTDLGSKYDGYRLRVERDGDRVRLIRKGGYDWSKHFPWIVEAALKNRQKQFVIDGEAVILGVDGYSDFNALHSRKHDDEVQLYAFDVLALDGDDLRKLPPTMRKTNLARLLARRSDGIFVAPYEAGEIGPDLFRAACRMGLEGLVSKHRDRAYRGGPCSHWVKVKNRNSPGNETSGRGRLVALMERPQKITFAEMRASGVRGLLIYCSDYHCSHWTAISDDQWTDDFRLSDLEPRFQLALLLAERSTYFSECSPK